MNTIAAAAFTMAALHAHAVSTDWGGHDAVELGDDKVARGSFEDTYRFSLDDGATLSATALSNNRGRGFRISDGLVSLYQVSLGSDVLVDSFGFDGSTGDSPFTFSSLLAGDYFYEVSGEATGRAGGWYSLASTPVSAVRRHRVAGRGLRRAGAGVAPAQPARGALMPTKGSRSGPFACTASRRCDTHVSCPDREHRDDDSRLFDL
ncbi:hypothetical protein [Piscinibacter sp.]|uniref:hypothetical protein n=1 Tax=Piscinibacter sp. TaxID=1903157 RepID=UPI002BB116A2|nr:hypothetical protein [Albitalea sp.]HUG22042.1 hypothetical protein [Albitalea sp.]